MQEKALKVAVGADHAGFELKEKIKNYLSQNNYVVKDFGTYSEDSVDYPDFAHAVADHISKGEFERGILVCGSGNGINMAANKHKGVRSALCWNDEVARLARSHNDANILALPGRFIDHKTAMDAVESFLNTEFEGGRHQKRINKIDY